MKKCGFFACGIVVLSMGTPGGAASPQRFTRGDADESGRIEITDSIRILGYLFAGAEGFRCEGAGDLNDDGRLDLTDVIQGLYYLFRQSAAPPAPFPACGPDPTVDGLPCEGFAPCTTQSITFLDIEVEAGGVFFVVDRSGNFAQGQLQKARQGLLATIRAFPSDTWFGIIFAAHDVLKFPESGQPAQASEEMRASALSFVETTGSDVGSCDLPSLLAALDFANRSPVKDDVIFYVGNGGGTCGGDEADYLERMLAEVTAGNQGIARIHSVGIGFLSELGEQFLRDLAAQNGGEFHHAPWE